MAQFTLITYKWILIHLYVCDQDYSNYLVDTFLVYFPFGQEKIEQPQPPKNWTTPTPTPPHPTPC